jgi:DNA-binding transcriptional LysR family regulator
MQTIPIGTVRAALPGSFGRMMLTPVINDFLARHTQLNLDLTYTDRRVDLVSEGIDLAVRIGNLGDSSLFARKLGSVAFVACASPDYLAARDDITEPMHLREHICLEFSLRYDRGVWSFKGDKGEIRVPISGRYRADQGEALADAAAKGLGVIYVPELLVRNELESGALIPLLADYMPDPVPMWALYPHNRHLSAKVRLLVDFLVERLVD